ncbi:MAG: ligase-associated DNA damage response endonuclease PdeM [Phycisphaerae bacterium]
MTESGFISAMQVRFAGREVVLLPERAAWLPGVRALCIADVHLGKTGAFRAAGLPVPAGTTASDLARLDGLLERLAPAELLILGDLLHARGGMDDQQADAFATLLRRHPGTGFTLVRGNHDRHAGDPPATWPLHVTDGPLYRHGLAFGHEPEVPAEAPLLAGHLHPVVRLRDFDGSSLRAPAFVAGERRLTLPAFGRFTGGAVVKPAGGERVYAVLAGRVIAVKGR